MISGPPGEGTTRDGSGNLGSNVVELALSQFETREFDPTLAPLATRTLSAMPAVIPYRAHLYILYRREDRGPETRFISYNAVEKPGDFEAFEAFTKPLDAFKILDAFLNVKSPDEALHFLRDTGVFLAHESGPLTWSVFERWQRFAESMRNADSRTALLAKVLPADLPESLKDAEDIGQLHRMARGYIDNTYLGAREPEPPAWFVTGRLKDVKGAKARAATLETIKKDHRDFMRWQATIQGEMAQQFIEPRPETYSIAFPKAATGENYRPHLVFDVHSTLEAIAAAIYVERIAGVVWSKCPVCGNSFKIGSQKGKRTCDRKCQDALKKRRKRPKPNDR